MPIISDMNSVSQNVKMLNMISQLYSPRTLSPSDEKSTITANEKGQNAFSRAQTEVQLFSDAMGKEVENLSIIGLTFEEEDNILAIYMKE